MENYKNLEITNVDTNKIRETQPPVSYTGLD